MERRSFISNSLLASSALLLPNALFAEKISSAGLQLYSLREDIDKNVLSTLKAVSKMGYNYVEGYANKNGHFFGYNVKEFGSILNDLGLQIKSTHIITGRKQPEVKNGMNFGMEKMIEDAKSLNIKYLVCPWVHPDEYKTIDELYSLCDFLNQKGEEAFKNGITLCYHNHDFEFETKFGDKTMYDIMLEKCDPRFVKFELDIYWITKGGYSAIEYFNKNSGRFPLWHVKDMNKLDKYKNAIVGDGIINWKEIFAATRKSGMEYFFVEQESYENTPQICVTKGLEYLKKMEF